MEQNIKMIRTKTGAVFVINHEVGNPNSIEEITEVINSYEKTHKSCPNCKKVGMIAKEFGWRQLGETTKPQSWCTKCRAPTKK